MARGTAKSTSRRNKGMSYTKWGYIFVAPFIIAYLIFSFYPLMTTFFYSAGNMKSSTASFWGFEHKEVFYDRYLNLSNLYTENFDERTGIDSVSYKRLREYFDKFQKSADSFDPLNEDGVNAIVSYANSDDGEEKYSVEAANAVKEAFDKQDMSPVIGDYYKELVEWYKGYKNETIMNRSTVSSVYSRLDGIVNTSAGEEESATETEDAVTEESFIQDEAFVTFVDEFGSAEYNVAQTALLEYLSDYLSTALDKDYTVDSYFQAVKNGEISISDPSFYYVCYTLDKTNINFAEEDAEEKIGSKISVPFLSNLEKFLSENVWKETINSLSSFSDLEAYSTGEKDLHDSEEQLYADLKTLNSAGIINITPLVKDGDKIVESDDYLENKLVALRRYIDTKYVANETSTKAAMQIVAIKNFVEACSEGQAPEKFAALNINIYGMINYNGEIDYDKYYQVKEALGLTDALSFESYKKLDEARRSDNVEKGKVLLEEQNALLPDAKAAFDEADKAYNADPSDENKAARKKAQEALRTVETTIDKANDMIKNPDGILSKVDSKKFYIITGLNNYEEIFKSKTRFNIVVGTFVNTAVMWVIGFLPQIGLALLLSAWFTDRKIKLKGLNLMKAMMYLPNVITSVTIAIFFRKIFTYSSGGTLSASQIVLRGMGMEQGYNFFESAWATRLIVCFINFWMWYGNTMITLIAGISAISESLYESAQIDGANSFQTYTKITMPLLRPILLYTMVTSMIGGLQMFDIPQNINRNAARINFNGTMVEGTRTVLMYINAQAFGSQQNKMVGIASAVAILLFIVTTILSVLIFYIMRDKDAAAAKKLAKKKGGK